MILCFLGANVQKSQPGAEPDESGNGNPVINNKGTSTNVHAKYQNNTNMKVQPIKATPPKYINEDDKENIKEQQSTAAAQEEAKTQHTKGKINVKHQEESTA